MRDRALGLLARREHSRLELATKLARKGFPVADQQRVLDELEAGGLLSDERFAAAYVESRADRGFGPVRIMQELGQRGIPGPVCREVCDPSSEAWSDRAGAARRKRFGVAVPAAFAERARQARFLAGRGFSRSQVNAALAGEGARVTSGDGGVFPEEDADAF